MNLKRVLWCVALFLCLFKQSSGKTVLEEYAQVKSDRYKQYRAMISSGGLSDDTPLSVSEWSQFYNLTGGGYYMNKFNLRLYDIIKVGGFGSLIYGMGFTLVLFGAFGGFGAPKQIQEMPRIVVVGFLSAITYLGAPQIYALTQVCKDALPTTLGVAIKKARALNNNIAYLMQTGELCGPNAQVPALAMQQGVNEAIESRGVVLNDSNLVATMQLYNMYAAHVNSQIPSIETANAKIATFDQATMGGHKTTFDGRLIDVSGAAARSDADLASYCSKQKVKAEDAGYFGEYPNIDAMKTCEASERLGSWPGFLTGEFPRMVKVYGSSMMKGRGMPQGYPLADRIWNDRGLEKIVLDYFHDLQDGKLTDQLDVDKAAAKIRDVVRTETTAYLDYAFVLQMQHHAYPSVRQSTAERYTPAAPNSMFLKMCRWTATMAKEGPEIASRWFSDVLNGIIRYLCEGGFVVPWIIRFADMLMDITIEVSVFFVVGFAYLVLIPSLRAVVIGQVNIIMTLCVTSGVLLLLFSIWEGILVAVGVWVYGYDPTSVGSALKIGGAAITAVLLPGLAAQFAFWAMIGMWVAKVVGYILMAFYSRKAAVLILRGESWVGGMIARGMTALGAGTLAAAAGMSATMLASGAGSLNAGWGSAAKGVFSGGPWKPTGGGAAGGKALASPSPGGISAGAVAAGGGPAGGSGGTAPIASGAGGAAPVGTPAIADDPSIGSTVTPKFGVDGGTNMGPIAQAWKIAREGGSMRHAASAFNQSRAVDMIKTTWEAAKVPLREVSHAVQSGGDPARYLKNRTQAKDAEEESPASMAQSVRHPSAPEMRGRSVPVQTSVKEPSSSGAGPETADTGTPRTPPVKRRKNAAREEPTNSNEIMEDVSAPELVPLRKKAQ